MSDGERIAALAASFEAEKNYQHERWHKLDNDLTPVVNLPEKLTRDIGKLQGLFEGRINAVSQEVARATEAAIEKALRPVTADIRKITDRLDGHDGDIGDLKAFRDRWTGAKVAILIIGQALLNAIVAIGAVISVGRHP